jgi:hypothetical protein
VLQHPPGSGNAAVYRVFCQFHHYSRSDRTDRALTDISRDLFVDRIPACVSVIIQHVHRQRLMDLKANLMRDDGSTHNTPGWVKMTGIIGIALLLLFGSLHLIGASLLGYAPGGHGDHARPSSAAEHRPQQP